jgi:beta-glucosidase
VAAAEAADVVVFVGGLTAEVEGEEMRVNYPGFAAAIAPTSSCRGAAQARGGAARHRQAGCARADDGSALGLRWAQETCRRSWSPGTRASAAAMRRDVLFGDTTPAGRLPVTFYESVADLAGFSDYAMEGAATATSAASLCTPSARALVHALRVSRAEAVASAHGCERHARRLVDVKNTGARAGDEVVQLYVRSPPRDAKAPNRSLRGFERVALKAASSGPSASSSCRSAILARYDEPRKALAVAPGEFEVENGASSADLRERGGSRSRTEPAAADQADRQQHRERCGEEDGSRRSAFTRQTKCTTPQTAAAYTSRWSASSARSRAASRSRPSR